MKIVRFISDHDRILYGKYSTERPDVANIIDGDIFRNFHVTSEKANIKRLLSPVNPSNILALGLNYRRHAEETGMDTPKYPILFMKATSSVIGHQEPILLPAVAPESVDYEAELAVVIDKSAKNLQPSEALDCILGIPVPMTSVRETGNLEDRGGSGSVRKVSIRFARWDPGWSLRMKSLIRICSVSAPY